MNRRFLGAIALCVLLAALAAPQAALAGGVVDHYPTSAYGAPAITWPTDLQWKPLTALNDISDMTSNEQVDLVGDGAAPAVYWHSDADYVYFRVRVDFDGLVQTTSPATFADSHFVFIDIVGTGTAGYPDYAIAWDTQSNSITKHGLEMMKAPSSPGTTWGAYQMVDLDGVPNEKVLTVCSASTPCDFGLTGDGYVRTVDQQSTAAFGNTTFIDIAAKWSYLELNTGLRKSGQKWKLQTGTRFSSTDHSVISTDVGGGCSPSSLVTACWTGEPTAVTLSSLSASAAGRDLPWAAAVAAAVAALGVVAGGVMWRRVRARSGRHDRAQE